MHGFKQAVCEPTSTTVCGLLTTGTPQHTQDLGQCTMHDHCAVEHLVRCKMASELAANLTPGILTSEPAPVYTHAHNVHIHTYTHMDAYIHTCVHIYTDAYIRTSYLHT